MRPSRLIIFCLALLLAACGTSPTNTPSPSPIPTTAILSSATPRITMLPTWTPSPTPPRKDTPTSSFTSTPLVTQVATGGNLPAGTPVHRSIELLLDRPTYSPLPKPTNLVSMQYDPNIWNLNTYYPTSFMGYSLMHRAIFDCKLEPSVGRGAEGYEVEHYSRQIGSTTFEIARVSQAANLLFANYCTGEGEDATCYQVTPGSDHSACTSAAEEVLSTFTLIPNPFIGTLDSSTNRWVCQNNAGTTGLCLISYSVPLNALAFTEDGQAWAAGDDGVLFHLTDQTWSEAVSPSTQPIFDLGFSSPTNGWAVGAGAQVYHWDGSTWSEVLPYHAPGEGPGGSTQMLYAVHTDSAGDAWMVGKIMGIDGKTSPYAIHWNGTDLVEQNNFPDCNCGLNAVLPLGKDDVIAAGGSDLGGITFHWDGSTWSSMLMPGADHLFALTQADDGSIWAAGIERARDLSDARGSLFRWDGLSWQRIAFPPLTGGVYAASILPTGQILLGGDFAAMLTGLGWQPITTDIAGYGWITDIEVDPQGTAWALTRSGNLFRLEIEP